MLEGTPPAVVAQQAGLPRTTVYSWVRRFAFAGTPEDIVRHIADLADRGATRVELGTPHGLDEGRALRLLGERVLPAFLD